MSIGVRTASIVMISVVCAVAVHGQDFQDELVQSWVDVEILPLDGSANTVDTEDLETLAQWIGDAEIVAFGESPHGVSQFAGLKRHIFEFLVQILDCDCRLNNTSR